MVGKLLLLTKPNHHPHAIRTGLQEPSTVDLQLHGKRALVRGSSAGIGEEIAKVLAQEREAVPRRN